LVTVKFLVLPFVFAVTVAGLPSGVTETAYGTPPANASLPDRTSGAGPEVVLAGALFGQIAAAFTAREGPSWTAVSRDEVAMNAAAVRNSAATGQG
jgi:hypothetical protein